MTSPLKRGLPERPNYSKMKSQKTVFTDSHSIRFSLSLQEAVEVSDQIPKVSYVSKYNAFLAVEIKKEKLLTFTHPVYKFLTPLPQHVHQQ